MKFDKIWYSFHQHRYWHGDVRYIQILRDSAGDYWLYVITDDTSTEPFTHTGESVGIDFGLKAFLTLNNGKKIEAPEFLKQSLNTLRSLHKSLSRKSKGSHNWYRAIRELARHCRKVANQRLDWHWKLATKLCGEFDIIVTETLNIEGMKRLWGRKISDLAPYQFFTMLAYKCVKHGKKFLPIDQWTPTTKPCSTCGHKNDNLALKDRYWTCPKCGSNHDRDINAAINILEAGLAASVEQM